MYFCVRLIRCVCHDYPCVGAYASTYASMYLSINISMCLNMYVRIYPTISLHVYLHMGADKILLRQNGHDGQDSFTKIWHNGEDCFLEKMLVTRFGFVIT